MLSISEIGHNLRFANFFIYSLYTSTLLLNFEYAKSKQAKTILSSFRIDISIKDNIYIEKFFQISRSFFLYSTIFLSYVALHIWVDSGPAELNKMEECAVHITLSNLIAGNNKA